MLARDLSLDIKHKIERRENNINENPTMKRSDAGLCLYRVFEIHPGKGLINITKDTGIDARAF